MNWNKDRVIFLRRTLKLTQSEFANLLGCRQQTISEWEQGIYEPANAYGKLLDQLESKIFVKSNSLPSDSKDAGSSLMEEPLNPGPHQDFAPWLD